MKKFVLVLSGASAAGKTAVANAMIEKNPKFTFLRSATTRPKRGDGNDDEYIYLTREEFTERIANGDVLENTEYAGNMYGTLYSEIERAESEGKIPLLVLDINGMRSLYRDERLAACTVFIYAPLAMVEERLRARFTKGENEDKIVQRLKINREDYLGMPELEPYVYSFAENAGELNDCRDAVQKIFDSYVSGCDKDVDTAKRIASELKADAIGQ